MKDFSKFVIGFAPWIAFGVLAGPSILKLETAIIVSLLLCFAVSFTELRKGFFLAWGTLLFFVVSAVMVIGLKNVWFMRHLSVFVPATMAAIAWGSLFAGKPFVLQIARESAPEDRWNDPKLIAGCRHLTIVWGTLFLFSLAVSMARFFHIPAPEWLYHLSSVASVLGGMAYTEWFKKHLRKAMA